MACIRVSVLTPQSFRHSFLRSACLGSERVLQKPAHRHSTPSTTARQENRYLRVEDVSVDLSQGLDLDCTEAAVAANSLSVSLEWKTPGWCECRVHLPLIWVDHVMVEVCVFLNDAQRHHICNVSVRVLQLVQLQVDFEQIIADGVWTGFQTPTHHIPAEDGSLTILSLHSSNQRSMEPKIQNAQKFLHKLYICDSKFAQTSQS